MLKLLFVAIVIKVVNKEVHENLPDCAAVLSCWMNGSL